MTPSIQRRSTTRSAFPATTTNRPRRAGGVALELILAFPVLLVLFAAIIEFGLIYTAVDQVAGASRQGAKSASEAGSIANLTTIVNNGSLRNTIDRFLATSGFVTGACRITVQHNNGGGNQVLTNDPGTGACTNCVAPTPPTQIPPNGNNPPSQTYVRVTVCVNLYPNVPDLLGTFGFSIQSRIIEQSTTFRLE